MCGRYRLDPEPELWDGSIEVFPRSYQPIVRYESSGQLMVERRRWAFHRTWPDKAKQDKWVKQELINADHVKTKKPQPAAKK